MQFELQRQSRTDACGSNCRVWVSATGVITADTPKLFESFSKGRDLRGVSIVLDSDGGSVLGAISLGREIRRRGMTTTVGRTVGVDSSNGGKKAERILPDASCESMCTFVLLAGVERYVPPQAHVLVHQIWLGDRRDDPAAATYSAEDLVQVQRDIGSLAQYTIEMGGTADLLALSLKIPPWEPLRLLSRDELRGTRLVTADSKQEMRGSVGTSAPALASGPRIAAGDSKWTLIEKAGRPAVARQHPLTVEGKNIGTFDMALTCGDSAQQYIVTYVEQRKVSSNGRKSKSLRDVKLYFGDQTVSLKAIAPPEQKTDARGTAARGTVPIPLMWAFAEPRNVSLTVETSSPGDATTTIRLGNAGLANSLSQLAPSCEGRKLSSTTVRDEPRSAAASVTNVEPRPQ